MLRMIDGLRGDSYRRHFHFRWLHLFWTFVCWLGFHKPYQAYKPAARWPDLPKPEYPPWEWRCYRCDRET